MSLLHSGVVLSLLFTHKTFICKKLSQIEILFNKSKSQIQFCAKVHIISMLYNAIVVRIINFIRKSYIM